MRLPQNGASWQRQRSDGVKEVQLSAKAFCLDGGRQVQEWDEEPKAKLSRNAPSEDRRHSEATILMAHSKLQLRFHWLATDVENIADADADTDADAGDSGGAS
jgi:hypothetical protein